MSESEGGAAASRAAFPRPLSLGELADSLAARQTGFVADAPGAGQSAFMAASPEDGPRHFVPQRPAAGGFDLEAMANEDPLREAWRQGHAEGIATAERLVAEARAESARVVEDLAMQWRDWLAAREGELATRLRDAAVALCHGAIDRFDPPEEWLERSARAAVEALLRDAAQPQIQCHPDDAMRLAPLAEAGATILPESAIQRGSYRIIGEAGGFEDGPDCWKQAIETAVRAC